MRSPGPVPETLLMSAPSSRAKRLTVGDAGAESDATGISLSGSALVFTIAGASAFIFSSASCFGLLAAGSFSFSSVTVGADFSFSFSILD